MLWGTTFSHKKATALKLDPFPAFKEILNLNFDYVRLGCYWDEIEPEPGGYNLSIIQRYLDYCEQSQQKVILTVGRKAPHWPEFYLPYWAQHLNNTQVRNAVYELTANIVQTCKNYSCISHWQIENEPLDPSGPQQLIIPLEELKHQIEIVRKLDMKRKIVVTVWGNEVIKRNLVPQIVPLCDIVGLDLYYRQFMTKILTKSVYAGPRQSEQALFLKKKQWNKPLWITELQAEPWEADNKTYHSVNPKSINAILLENNIAKAKLIHPETILLWGSEYWLWKKIHGDPEMWETIKKILNNK